MASWSELVSCLQGGALKKDPGWLDKRFFKELSNVSKLRGDTTVIFYASSFLQKGGSGSGINISREDINGFMNALYGAKTDKGLTLILHTPGGDPNAVESIVEYLHGKFSRIEVIVPYLAMSGGAMISLASDLLVLGKQSQLGPIDPQLSTGGKAYSTRAIREGFSRAKEDIGKNINMGHLWAPILQNMGPSLVIEAGKALSYSKELVVRWMKRRMFKDMEDEVLREKAVNGIAAYFNAEDTADDTIHVHGQRIGAEKLRELGIRVEMLEDSQELQSSVLTTYHLMTLIFERTPSLKFIASNEGKMWSKAQSPLPSPAKLVPAKPVQKKG